MVGPTISHTDGRLAWTPMSKVARPAPAQDGASITSAVCRLDPAVRTGASGRHIGSPTHGPDADSDSVRTVEGERDRRDAATASLLSAPGVSRTPDLQVRSLRTLVTQPISRHLSAAGTRTEDLSPWCGMGSDGLGVGTVRAQSRRCSRSCPVVSPSPYLSVTPRAPAAEQCASGPLGLPPQALRPRYSADIVATFGRLRPSLTFEGASS